MFAAEVPTYLIDLKSAETERWAEVISREKAVGSRLVREANAEFESVPELLRWIFAGIYKAFGGLYQGEIRSWADGLGASVGTITILNCAYELSHVRWPKLFGCTAGVRWIENLGMVHVRNLDWPLATMGAATRLFRFRSGAREFVATSDDYLEEVIAILKSDKAPPSTVKPDDGTATIALEPSAGEAKLNLAERAVEETEDYLLRQWSRTTQQFEHVVAAVFRAMGYTAHVQQGTHDLGVDVVAHPDPLGVQPPVLKIQAKSGTGKVGAKEVKELRGLLNQGEKGVLVALGGFSIDSRHVQQNDADLVLIDGERFVQLFLEFYDRLDPQTRNQFPLRRVYVYAG